MKKFIIIAVVFFLFGGLMSCKKGYFDQVPDDRLTLAVTFNSRANAEQFLANIYSRLPDQAQERIDGGHAGPWTGGSDEAEYVWDNLANQINVGEYDATTSAVGAFWVNYYSGIRSADVFMQNIAKVPDLSAHLKSQYIAEARALRAIYYFYMMQIYGPLVILPENPIAPDADLNSMQLSRTPFDDCVNYVTNELDLAAKNLPATPVNDDSYGRITSGFAMAMKAEVLLYAASPLYNGNSDYSGLVNKDGKHLINQQYDAAKWKKAADAAKAFIDQYVPNLYSLYTENDSLGNFSPYLSCRNVMLKDWNSEIIYARISSSVEIRQYDETPFHAGNADGVRGGGGLGATQTMVDAYFTENGRSITDPESGYINDMNTTSFQAPGDDQARETFNAWAHREPRFYVGITYSGSKWLNTANGDVITDLSGPGNSGINVGVNNYSKTGYVVRKNVSTGDWDKGNRSWVMLRLAQIYLDYAEALNESSPGNPDILKYVNLIRSRAGIPLYGGGLPAPSGQDAMRDAIHKERRVELAFESTRYFDVRRWKVASATDNTLIYGLNIHAPVPYFYVPIPIEGRVFTKRDYFFPIPQSDINADKQLVQNTGW